MNTLNKAKLFQFDTDLVQMTGILLFVPFMSGIKNKELSQIFHLAIIA